MGDAMDQMQESLAYKCPNCGGDLKFAAEKQLFGCEFCMSEFTEAEMKGIAGKQEEIDLQEQEKQQQERQEFAEQTDVYVCNSCGAEIMADCNTAATFCYYCHNPVILKGRVAGEYRPAYVLPFQLNREQAVECLHKWCKGRWFLPKDFLSDAQIEKLTGLYVPFWVTDCDVSARMDALGKRVRTWTSGNYRYTETKEYALTRKANVALKGLPADGATHIDDKLMEAVEPFDYQKAKPFAMQYLSGFFAEKYDMDTAAVFPRVKQRAVQASDRLLRSSMQGYSSISVTSSDIKLMRTTWEYMLLPVWFMTYRHGDKVYEFAVNGQSGKFIGNMPLDWKKLGWFSAGLGLAAALAALLLLFFLGGGGL